MNIEQTITLNLPDDLSDSDWKKVDNIFKQMDGWIDGCDYPYWFGTDEDDRYIWASAEPSGLVLFGKIDKGIWIGWITVLCAKLTLALGREIHDAEA